MGVTQIINPSTPQIKADKLLAELPLSQQEEVLDFALFLHHKQTHSNPVVQSWEAIADEDAALLRAEFAAEDATLTESILHDYLSGLQRETPPEQS